MMKWVEYKISDFLKRIKRGVPIHSEENYELLTIKLYHKGIIPRGSKNGSEIKAKTMFLVKEGDFILSGIDARNGAFGIVPKELDGAVVTNDFWYFEIDEQIIDKRLFLELTNTKWFDDICKKGSDGTTNRIRLQKDKFFNQVISLPPIEKQYELRDKLINIRKLIIELDEVIKISQKNILKLKDSILHGAITGELTKEWRTVYSDTISSDVLLNQIKAEKETINNSSKRKKEKRLPSIDRKNILFEIPESWSWCRLIDICKYIQRGKSPNYVDLSSIPVISQKCIQWDGFDITKARFINEETISKYDEERFLEEGDLLWNSTGDGTVGRVALFPKVQYKRAVADSHVTVVRSLKNKILPKYLWIYTASPLIQKTVLSKISGSTKQTELSTATIKALEFSLPPIEEQYEIITKVDKLFAYCKQMENELLKQQIQSENLLESAIYQLLGGENSITNRIVLNKLPSINKREIKYDSKTTYMELIKLLREHGKLHAEDLWKMSEFPNDIDAFYAELKKQIEEEKTIKEAEKGYLELA